MPLDPQAQQVLDQLAALGLPPNHMVSPQQARENMRNRPRVDGPEVAKVEDRSVSWRDAEVPVRIYTPAGTGPFPILIWCHGGGMVVGDLETADATARHLTVETGCVTVSVDYRLAPETKFPGACDDCYAAAVWASDNAASIQGDASRMAVGGDSAGGNLAAVVAQMARDRANPDLAFQLLVYPMTSLDFETPSYVDNADGYLLTRDSMKWYWDQYLGASDDPNHPYAVPSRAGSFKNLPPALVITAEFDPLRDEGEAYAKSLEADGVPTTHSRYDGMIHGFFGMSGAVDKAGQAVSEAAAAMKKTFASK
jgi:acetyl esterase